MNHLHYLPVLNLKISVSGEYSGSGVVVKVDERYIIFTAFHVIGTHTIDSKNISEFNFISERGINFKFLLFLSSKDFHDKYDVAVIEVSSDEEIANFPDVNFCTEVDFPFLNFIFRGTSKSVSRATRSIPTCTIDTLNDEKCTLRIPQEYYVNTDGEFGADVLQGYSGSGVFIENDQSIYLVGIVVSVTNHTFPSVNFITIKAIKESCFNDLPISDFNSRVEQMKISAAEIRRGVTDSLINERKESTYGDVQNIGKKMDFFLPDWTTEDMDGFITDIMVWEIMERDKIRNQPHYRDLIDESKAELYAGSKVYVVSNVKEGNERFHKIEDDFKKIIEKHLLNTPLYKNSNVIAKGEIARLLANCKLKFKNEN